MLCIILYSMCWNKVKESMASWVNHINLVSPGHRNRRERKEGWADIFTRKGSKKRRQAKLKRPQKSTPLCSTVRVCVRLWGLKCIFSWLLPRLLRRTRAVQEASRDPLKRSNCITLCLHGVTTVVSTRETEHRSQVKSRPLSSASYCSSCFLYIAVYVLVWMICPSLTGKPLYWTFDRRKKQCLQ